MRFTLFGYDVAIFFMGIGKWEFKIWDANKGLVAEIRLLLPQLTLGDLFGFLDRADNELFGRTLGGELQRVMFSVDPDAPVMGPVDDKSEVPCCKTFPVSGYHQHGCENHPMKRGGTDKETPT